MNSSILYPLLFCCTITGSFAQNSLLGTDRSDDLVTTSVIHPEYRSPVSPASGGRNYISTSRASISVEPARLSAELTLRSGTMVGISATGDTQFIAHYKRNKLKGSWVSWFHPDQLCDSGALKNNIPDGTWASWYPNGNLRFIRTYDAFKLEKVKQDIRIRQSKTVTSPLAVMARRNLKAAQSYLHPDYSFHTLAARSRRQSGMEYWQSLNERVSSNIAEDASDYIPPFLECLHHGLYMNFFEDGSVKDSGYYKNGLREGIWEEWVDNGNIRSQGFYTQGHKTDTWKYYNRNGQLKSIRTYNRFGKEIHRKSFNSGSGLVSAR